MAITKLIRIKEKPQGDPGRGLKKALCYICNPEKAEVIGGNAGHDAGGAYFLMKQNKEYWHKEDGTQGFHYILSFPRSFRNRPAALRKSDSTNPESRFSLSVRPVIVR